MESFTGVQSDKYPNIESKVPTLAHKHADGVFITAPLPSPVPTRQTRDSTYSHSFIVLVSPERLDSGIE